MAVPRCFQVVFFFSYYKTRRDTKRKKVKPWEKCSVSRFRKAFITMSDVYCTAPWCVLTRFSPVSCFADLQEQNVFKIDFEHKFEKFRTLAFHWYQFYQDLNNFY